jgi:cytoplasmic iron level regulating protein YaaA (DUF328/UPF0246 family)
VTVLVLLPPSEGKSTSRRRGAALDLDRLAFPELAATRRRLLDELGALCSGHPQKARNVLGLSAGLAAEVDRNRHLGTAPAIRVDQLYTGVLYDALDLTTLDVAARRRATRSLVVFSALWGVLRLTDRVPAYRLAPDVSLPGTGSVAALWRTALPAALDGATKRGLVLDLRSTAYASMWRPTGPAAARMVQLRVLHERVPGNAGSRVVVSHFNKATKGRLVRALLDSGADPRTSRSLVAVLRDLGYDAAPSPAGRGTGLDVVVAEL